MNDTPEYIAQKQFEIIYKKPAIKRFLMSFEMTNFAHDLLESTIRSKQPGISEINLKIEVFKRFYINDFSESEMNRIIESMQQLGD